MGKKKKVKAPVYEQLADTDYIAGLRDDLGTYRDYFNNALGNINVLDPEIQNQFKQVANDYTQAQWNDLNRAYNQQANQLAQRNYNRFGGLANSNSIITNDALNRQYNDLATRVAASTASQYNQLMNDEFNRRYNLANLYGATYTGAGNTLQSNDIANWNIRNQNINAQYVADVQNAQGGNTLGNAIGGAISGASTGASFGGPWGALAGAVIGGVGGALAGDANQSKAGAGVGQLIYKAQGNQGTWLGNKLNLGTKANQIVSTPTN